MPSGSAFRGRGLSGTRARVLKLFTQSMAPASLVGASRDWTPEEVARREIALYPAASLVAAYGGAGRVM